MHTIIGCFELEKLSEGRWRVVNTITSVNHVTYGTKQEVVEQLEIQAKAWKERMTQMKGALMTIPNWRRQQDFQTKK